MTTYSRRSFFKFSMAAAAGFAGMRTLMENHAWAAPMASNIVDGFGPTIPDPNGIFDLPEKFTYKIISKMGDSMNDGFLVPGAADGMAAFPGPEGKTILVRNHELSNDAHKMGPYGEMNRLFGRAPKELLYDTAHGQQPCIGGTTTVVFDTKTQSVVHEYLSLTGTIRNCAGGPTPWGSWVTCEETVQRAEGMFEQDHGYNFEVPAQANGGLTKPIALKAMGRFNHEAVAVDPQFGIVYQTEDRQDGLIYRFVPNTPGHLAGGGILQSLVVCDRKSCDTRNWGEGDAISVGAGFEVEWMDMQDVESPNDDLRIQGFEGGAARFARGEGMWYGHGGIYFACTNGGHAKKGQIWKYTQGESIKRGRLELFVEPNEGTLIENCDNLTVAPWGDLVVCEDGDGDQFLVGITPEGSIYKFGRNAVSASELAGATFSPDGSTLFVNIQHNGLTLAITGPWRTA
ncbi:MAG: hypothetical protein AMXMBFR84_31930 [Candidatus Hydrogenedentota bacterium]